MDIEYGCHVFKSLYFSPNTMTLTASYFLKGLKIKLLMWAIFSLCFPHIYLCEVKNKSWDSFLVLVAKSC